MKLIHVVPHISAEASGPSYSVPRLCQALAARGHELTLACLAAGREVPGVEVEVHPSWPFLRQFAVSPQHARALRAYAAEADIVHNHSLWSMVNVAAGWVVPGRGAKLVTSPRGTLSEWALANSKRRKQMLWPLQRRVLERADLLHATSEAELSDIRRAGLRVPVAVIPNGIDIPSPLGPRQADPDSRTLLFLSRVHPVKGIESLLDAWTMLESRHPDWALRIVGPGDAAYAKSLSASAAAQGARRVTFVGPLYGEEKKAAYRNAELFVLPSHSENFGVVVAEALAQGCPAVVSHGAPWAGLETEGCGWWIPNDADSLRATLHAAMSKSTNSLNEMGAKGRAWMERGFGWGVIAMQMETAYRWTRYGGTAPDWVRIT